MLTVRPFGVCSIATEPIDVIAKLKGLSKPCSTTKLSEFLPEPGVFLGELRTFHANASQELIQFRIL